MADCQSTCDRAGARRCAADLSGTEICEEVRPGCLRWVDDSLCALPKRCLEKLLEPICEEPVRLPSHYSEEIACSQVGDKRCNGNTLQTCTDQGNGCLLWQGEDCGSRGGYCVEAGATASCEQACSSNYAVVGKRRCFGSGDPKKLIQTCTETTDTRGKSCKMWLTTDACGGDALFCTDDPQVRCHGDNIFLPLVKGAKSDGYASSIQIQNVGDTDTKVTVSYTPGMAGSACIEMQTIPFGQSRTFALGAFASGDNRDGVESDCAKGERFIGSAEVTSNSANQPLVAVVNEDNEEHPGEEPLDQLMVYEGIPVQ